MVGWVLIIAVAASIGISVSLVILFINRCCYLIPRRNTNTQRADTLETGIQRLHHVSTFTHHHDQDNNKRRTNYYLFRGGVSAKQPLFSWADNPSLITDAVENGWSRFAFTAFTASPSVRSTRSLLGVCAAVDQGGETGVDISWEVCQGSADFMQKIRLNSGLNKFTSNSPLISVIKTALPLPGPLLGNSSSFPQEAYFEITILGCGENDGDELVSKVKVGKGEGEKIKLIQESFDVEATSESLIHVTSSNRGQGNSKLEELKIGSKGDGRGEAVMLCLGLSGGGSLPLKLPGSYPGSIGFNSNGSVHLDGIKLVFESEKDGWGKVDKVIGCGYNPSKKKVFFTLNSELVHEIHCQSEEFGTPLYPTLVSNADVMVLVNFGQSVFKYAQANLQRTPNPCFIQPLANSPTLSFDDSKELFSMGRIDSQWLNRSNTNRGTYHNKGVDFDEVSEGDLFEIVLDSSRRSPNTPF